MKKFAMVMLMSFACLMGACDSKDSVDITQPSNMLQLSTENFVLVENLVIDEWPNDAVAIRQATIVGDSLTVVALYGGGCVEHEFLFIASTSFGESFPVQTQVLLSHNANSDGCEAYIQNELAFDLTPLKTVYQQMYQTGSGAITLNFSNLDEPVSVNYVF